MSKVFSKLIANSRRISKDDYSMNFGGIAEDVIDMLDSEQSKKAISDAREKIENGKTLTLEKQFGQEYAHIPLCQQIEFGKFSVAEELENGNVAAIDGTNTLPMQLYTTGQALCVGIGSISHTRPMSDSLHYWSSKLELEQSKDTNDLIRKSEENIFGVSPTAFLRYYEIKHSFNIAETYIFFDGTLVYEWLILQEEGLKLYEKLFANNKKYIGIIKNLKVNSTFSIYSRALEQGELFIFETLEDHLKGNNAHNKNWGELNESNRWESNKEFIKNYASKILRGVYKPRKKAFGFEVYIDHLEDMIRIMAADTQLNYVGHEIPFLLNRIDEEVKRTFNQNILKDVISARMAKESDDLFIQETNERDFR